MSNVDKKICPECGNANPGNWIACANCGGALPASALSDTSKAASASSANRPGRSTYNMPAPAPAGGYQGQFESGWSRGFDQAWGFGCGCITFIIVLVLFLGWVGSTPSTIDSTSGSSSSIDSGAVSDYTLDQYSSLYTGMSYDEAAAIMGSPGTEASRNEVGGYVTVAYTWQNSDGSNLILMFQNDKLVQKSQAGLQ